MFSSSNITETIVSNLLYVLKYFTTMYVTLLVINCGVVELHYQQHCYNIDIFTPVGDLKTVICSNLDYQQTYLISAHE